MCIFVRKTDAMGHALTLYERKSEGCPCGKCPKASCEHREFVTSDPLEICHFCKSVADHMARKYIDYNGRQGHENEKGEGEGKGRQ